MDSRNKKERWNTVLFRLIENPWINTILSILLLLFLITYRRDLCPELFHFMTSMVDEELYFLNVMVLWLTWKCYLHPKQELANPKIYTASEIFENRAKVVTLGLFEMLFCLSLLHDGFDDKWPYVYCLSVFAFVAVRSLFYEQLDLTCLVFLGIYVTQNSVVHLVDLVFHQSVMQTINDEQLFLRMFSYKLFQVVLVSVMSVVYSQTLCPTIGLLKESPRLLTTLFSLTIPLNLLMLVTYLFELTFYDQHQRASIFKTQLTKVFVSNVTVYLGAIIYSQWIQNLVDYTQKYYREFVEFNLQKDRVEEEVQRLKVERGLTEGQALRWIDRKMNYSRPQVEIVEQRVNQFNPVFFEQSEFFDFLSDRFDLFVIKHCMHFVEVEDEGLSGESNVYVDIMRQVQTSSTFLFFFLVHIPLSRMNSMCCFLTCFVPLMLNLKTLYWFYEKTNQFVCWFFKSDKEAINYVQKPKHLQFKATSTTLESRQSPGAGIILSKLEIEMQQSAAMTTVIYLSVFFSLLINYLYSVFLQEVMVSIFIP